MKYSIPRLLAKKGEKAQPISDCRSMFKPNTLP